MPGSRQYGAIFLYMFYVQQLVMEQYTNHRLFTQELRLSPVQHRSSQPDDIGELQAKQQSGTQSAMRENMVNIICIHWQKYLQDHTCLEYLAHSGALIKGDTRKDGQQTTLAQMSGRQGLSFLKDSIIMLSAICLLLTKQRLLSMAYLFTMGLHSR